MDDKRTVRAGRRRPSGQQDGERERAEAPERRRPEGSSTGGTGSGGTGSGGTGGGGTGGYRPSSGGTTGGQIPLSPKMRMIVFGILIVVAVCYYGVQMLSGNTPELPADQPLGNEPELAITEEIDLSPTNTPRPRQTNTPRPQAAGAATSGDKWLVMLYQDADDKILEEDIYIDLNEAEQVGSDATVQVVAQVDRFRAGYTGDGDWAGTRRYYVTQDDDLNRVQSDLVEDLGEANMSAGETLVDFVTWATQNYPADKYALILSDHGMGWPGGWSDPTATGRGPSGVPLARALGDQLYLDELDQALEDIRQQTGIEKFELLGMDACLMGHLEVLNALEPHARYAVLSQETEPALGWAYSSFLTALQQNPGMDGAELGQLIVGSYIEDDQRIVDDQARSEFLSKGSPFGGLFGAPSADQLAQQLGRGITLTAFDLGQLPALTGAVNDLAYTLQSADQRGVAQARTYAQSFTSIFGQEVPASYIDLGSFVQLLAREVGGQPVSQAAQAVLQALEAGVISERHGPDKPGATGVSIYFPNSQLYSNPAAGPESYTKIASRFADVSLWDNFLAFHYAGREFEAETRSAAVPLGDEITRAPGAGKVTLSTISISARSAAPGRPVLLSTDISGESIGYIKLFAGFLDQTANSLYIADMDFLESPETREIDGVYYPDWGEGDFTLEFEWEPLVFAINDGENRVVALLAPSTYGASPEDAVYTVDGIYTYTSGEQRPARLYFRDGVLRQVYGFTSEDGRANGVSGAPREIIPHNGDTFTILEQWLDVGAGSQSVTPATQEGDTLTFGEQMFTWQEMDAAAGEYVVGFIVEDMDGNVYQVNTRILVE